MPTPDKVLPGAPCWTELATSDPGRAQEFYCSLFGWEAEGPAEAFGGYVNFASDGRRVAGCLAAPAGSQANVWSVYLSVLDARQSVAKAQAAGARLVAGPAEVGELGAMAIMVDPGGATVGMWQAGAHAGFGALGQPGAPAWFELYSRAYDVALEFYRTAFGWTTEPVSEAADFRYSVLRPGPDALAGVMDASQTLPEGVASHWSVYFEVSDTDAAVARVLELGGEVLRPSLDSPFGRLSVVCDPMGAQFTIIASPSPSPS